MALQGVKVQIGLRFYRALSLFRKKKRRRRRRKKKALSKPKVTKEAIFAWFLRFFAGFSKEQKSGFRTKSRIQQRLAIVEACQ
jgi:hypothetical protein